MLEHTSKAKKLYNSAAWLKLREYYLETVYHICERCGNTADIVHHIEHLDIHNIDNPEITLNADNLEALCIDCHNKEHFEVHKPTVDGLKFDKQGNLVEDK